MEKLIEIYCLLTDCHLAIKRNGHSALNQGKTRGLSLDDIIVINSIKQNNDNTIQMIAQRTSRDVASISRQISTLCNDGWLEKQRGKDDNRERVISLTERAHDMLSEADSQLAKIYSAMIASLSPIENQELLRMLRALIDAL